MRGHEKKTEAGRKSFIFSEGTRGGAFTRAVGRSGVIALHPVAGLLVGGGLGMYLQREYGLGSWVFWTLLLLGTFAGCRNAWRDYRAMLREQNEEAPGNRKNDVAKKP